jgi:hypothetical protein
MESHYRLLKVNKEVSFGEYHVKYTKKEHKERKEGAEPVDINKESLKVMKGGVKVKLRKKEKLALIEAMKEDNVDKMHELLQTVKSLSSQK